MKFIYQDFLNFLSEKPPLEILSEKLFQLGHEHEVNDEVFDELDGAETFIETAEVHGYKYGTSKDFIDERFWKKKI